MKYTIYTMADAHIYTAVHRLIMSIIRVVGNTYRIVVIDRSLTPEQRQELSPYVEWIDGDKTIRPGAEQALLLTSLVGQKFIWLDADTWVQSASFFDRIIASTKIDSMSYVTYSSTQLNNTFFAGRTFADRRKLYIDHLPTVDADRYYKLPYLNVGVLAGNECDAILSLWADRCIDNIYKLMGGHITHALALESTLVDLGYTSNLSVNFNFIPHYFTAIIENGFLYYKVDDVFVIHNLLKSANKAFIAESGTKRVYIKYLPLLE